MLVPSCPLLIHLPLSFVHLEGRGELLANVAAMLHFSKVIRLLSVYIVKEVFEFAEAGRLPIIARTEVSRFSDGLILEVVVMLLYLVDKVLLKNRINSVIRPPKRFRPEDECVDLAVLEPALLVVLV